MNHGELTDATCDAVDMGRQRWGPRARLAIAEAVAELCSTLRLSTPLSTFVVTPGLGTYSISSGLGLSGAVAIRDIFYQPVGQTQAGPPLERTSPSRIDEIRSRAISNSYPMQYAIAGLDTLELGPSPSDAGTLSVRYVMAATPLAADSDLPPLPDGFADLVWMNAACRIALLRRPPLPAAVVTQLEARYQRRLGDLRSWIVDLGGAKPMRMQRRGDSIPNRDPSVYPAIQPY